MRHLWFRLIQYFKPLNYQLLATPILTLQHPTVVVTQETKPQLQQQQQNARITITKMNYDCGCLTLAKATKVPANTYTHTHTHRQVRTSLYRS